MIINHNCCIKLVPLVISIICLNLESDLIITSLMIPGRFAIACEFTLVTVSSFLI